MKIINSSGIFNNKTICHNSSYFLSFGKRELQSFEISSKWFLLLRDRRLPFLSAAFQQSPHLKASKLNERRGRLFREMLYFKGKPVVLNSLK